MLKPVMSNIVIKNYMTFLGETISKRSNYYLLNIESPAFGNSKIIAGWHLVSPPDLRCPYNGISQ